jgi:ABC-type polar amino acid transport system ATPase subunit
MIRLENVSKSFGLLEVLHGISVEIARGEVVCVIGPSGSGKSTMLRCINNLEPIDDGTIYIEGEPVYRYRKNGKLVVDDDRRVERIRAQVGMVFQSFNLFPHLSALDNVRVGPVHVLGQKPEPAGREARALLEKVGLGDKVHAFPQELSGGQQQRVAIARALAMKPKAMLFDEVTSALDPELVGRGAEGDAAAGGGGDDHDRGHPRDGLRARGRRPRRLHVRGPHCRDRHPAANLRVAAAGADATVPPVGAGAEPGAGRRPAPVRTRESPQQGESTCGRALSRLLIGAAAGLVGVSALALSGAARAEDAGIPGVTFNGGDGSYKRAVESGINPLRLARSALHLQGRQDRPVWRHRRRDRHRGDEAPRDQGREMGTSCSSTR